MLINTYLPDTDLVYGRIPLHEHDDDGLDEIAFEDMEPIEGFDLVGIEPHTAIAISPMAEFDCIGVAPYGAIACTPIPPFPHHVMADLTPDAVPTEEFSNFEEEPEAIAL